MREEIALRVAHVGPVEPDVAEVEEPVQDQRGAAAGGGGRRLEVAAVQERPVGRRERHRGPPVAGNGDVVPSAVVVVGSGELTAEVLVGDGGAPRPRQIHARTLSPSRFGPASADTNLMRRWAPATILPLLAVLTRVAG